jgi:type II secretory ATPase GspE/PulE/Tfp pilus assembly ATPase PilB-like protein
MNCARCSGPYHPPVHVLREWFETPPPDAVWMRGRGCAACNNSGYSGRTIVAELWVPSTRESLLITKRASSEELRREALANMRCLGESALGKAMKGLTTLEEAFRVVPYEDVLYLRQRAAELGALNVHGPGDVLDREIGGAGSPATGRAA